MLKYANEDEGFHHEGIEINNGFLEITIFGDEWMYVMQALTKSGTNIETYGSIDHEHGCTEYYALNPEGKTYYEIVDFEGEYNDHRQGEIIGEWLSVLPNEVNQAFPDLFDEELDEDEDEDEDEDLEAYWSKDNKSALEGKVSSQFKKILDAINHDFGQLIQDLALDSFLGSSYESMLMQLKKVKKDGKEIDPHYSFHQCGMAVSLSCGENPSLLIDIQEWDGLNSVDIPNFVTHMSSALGLEDEYKLSKGNLSKSWRWSWGNSKSAVRVDLQSKGAKNECHAFSIQIREFHNVYLDFSPDQILNLINNAPGNDGVFGVEWKAIFDKNIENDEKNKTGEINVAIYRMLLNGVGVQQNSADAKAWLQKGADSEKPFCLHALGHDLYHGQNFEQDMKRGLDYIKLAASKGHNRSIKLLKKLG
jgi:hypothetical protein